MSILQANVSGVTLTLRSIGKKKADASATIAEVLQKNADIIFARSQILVPVDTTALKSSGKVTVTGSGAGAKLEVAYGGGGAVHYAVYVHESVHIPHKPPTMAKFLSRAAVDTKGTRAAMTKRLIGTTLTGVG